MTSDLAPRFRSLRALVESEIPEELRAASESSFAALMNGVLPSAESTLRGCVSDLAAGQSTYVIIGLGATAIHRGWVLSVAYRGYLAPECLNTIGYAVVVANEREARVLARATVESDMHDESAHISRIHGTPPCSATPD
jgi:hypothetical protein